MIDPAGLLRAASALAESGAALRRLAPNAAADYDAAVTALKIVAANLQGWPLPSPPTPAAKAPQVPACRPPRLSRHRQVEIITTWYFSRQEQFEGQAPPTEAQDVADARVEARGVSRAVIRRHRPVAWQVGRDKKPKSPKS